MAGRWLGVIPKECDICFQPIGNEFVDGKTHYGPWASMCTECHKMHGVGLGLGRGQKYNALTGEQVETQPDSEPQHFSKETE